MSYPLEPINTALLPSFQPWTDEFGMAQINAQGGTSDNGNLFTAHYVAGIVLKKLITADEKRRILQVYKNNFNYPGILARFPGDTRTEAQDDHFGLMGAEALLCPDPKDRAITAAIYEYGKAGKCDGIDSLETDPTLTKLDKWLYIPFKILGLGRVRWMWNNRNPGKFAVSEWLGRFFNLVATMQMSQRKFVNPFYWTYWCAIMLLMWYKPNVSDLDSYALNFHSALACQGYGPLTNWVCGKVHAAIKRDYGDMGQFMAAYVGTPNNPYTTLLSGIY